MTSLPPAAIPPRSAAETFTRVRTLRHEGRLLPNAVLNPHAPYGAACRSRFDGRSLREAAEYVCDCDADPGPRPDDFTSLFTHRTGTIGAKQALLGALALEIGREDVELIVACCELRLVRRTREAGTLPLAVCYLRYRGRRLQLVQPGHGSQASMTVVTETVVPPQHLADERLRLYRAFAADWCRALERAPAEFARLRSQLLRQSAGSGVFEDLLGYSLPLDFAPAL